MAIFASGVPGDLFENYELSCQEKFTSDDLTYGK